MTISGKMNTSWYSQPALWMRKLYNWVLDWAATPYSTVALFVLAFAESSFFPVPPDVLLMAMVLAAPLRAFFFAALCSLGSVTGGLGGYAIGYFLWEAVHKIFIPHVFSQHMFDLVQQKYAINSFWIVFTAAFTPIPYKIFTIAAGVCKINIWGFVVASIVGRSLRFFLVAGLLRFFGEKMRRFIEKYFEWLSFVLVGLLFLGFWLIKKIL